MKVKIRRLVNRNNHHCVAVSVRHCCLSQTADYRAGRLIVDRLERRLLDQVSYWKETFNWDRTNWHDKKYTGQLLQLPAGDSYIRNPSKQEWLLRINWSPVLIAYAYAKYPSHLLFKYKRPHSVVLLVDMAQFWNSAISDFDDWGHICVAA